MWNFTPLTSLHRSSRKQVSTGASELAQSEQTELANTASNMYTIYKLPVSTWAFSRMYHILDPQKARLKIVKTEFIPSMILD